MHGASLPVNNHHRQRGSVFFLYFDSISKFHHTTILSSKTANTHTHMIGCGGSSIVEDCLLAFKTLSRTGKEESHEETDVVSISASSCFITQRVTLVERVVVVTKSSS